MAEAYVGADLATGELLTTSERIDKLAEGSGKLGSTAGTIAGGIRFGQGLKARFAKPKTGVPTKPKQIQINKQIGDAASDSIAKRFPEARREVTLQTSDGPRRIACCAMGNFNGGSIYYQRHLFWNEARRFKN